MRVVDILHEHLPPLARLYAALSGLPSDLARMTAVHERMAGRADWHLLGAIAPSGALAGTLLGVVCQDMVGACRPFVVVENVIVAEAFRRRGVGRLLFAEIERRAAAQDCFYVMLVSGSERQEARAFYQALGYETAAGFKKRL